MSYGQSSFFVNTAGDTVNCKITRLTNGYLFYTIEGVRSRIEMERVQFHTGLTQDTSAKIQMDSLLIQREEPRLGSIEQEEEYPKPQRIRIAANIGGGYRVARSGNDLPRSYVNQLRKGLQYNVKAQYFSRNDIGFGAELHQFFNKAEENIPMVGDVSSDITISYYGLSYIQRGLFSDNENRSYIEAGFGLVIYEDDGTLDGQPVLIEGSTFGITLQYGYDVVISETMSVGFEVGVLLASLSSIDVNGTTMTAQNPEDGESLTRINFSMGLRFSK